MVVWKQWKYPLTLSLFFLLTYGFLDILDPTPSVNLPDDMQLLINDQQRLQVPGDASTDVPVIVEDNIRAVVASDLWYPDENANKDNRRQWLDSKNLENDQVQNKLIAPRTQDKGRISEENSLHDDKSETRNKKYEVWLERREIIGNERFVNRFQNGIQKPEDFYERNRDMIVKLQSIEHASSTTETQSISADYLKPKRSEDATKSLLHLITRPTLLTTDRSETYSDVHNKLSSTKTKPLNLTTDLEHFIQRPPSTHTSFYKADSLHEVNNKTELGLTISSVNSVKGSQNNVVGNVKKSPASGSRSQTRRRSRVNGTTLADLESTPYPPMIVKTTGAFLDRVHAYNAEIAAVGAEILRRRGYGPWRDVADQEQLNVVWGNTDDFLERLSEHSAVKTILLPWLDDPGSHWSSLEDRANVLVKEYFAWSATPPLCAWIHTPGFTKARWDAVYDRECNEDMSLAARPQSLEFMYFYAKPINIAHYWPNYGTSYPAYFYWRPPPHVFYVHLLQDVVVNTVGDVISGNLKLVPYTCSHDNLPTIPQEYPERPVYRELFVMTQFWGQSFFHKVVEVMPRVAPYVDFLRANPGVQIHAPEDRSQVSEMLQMLGVDPVRIVTGITRAKLIYLPQGTPCGFPDARSIQLLSRRLRQHVRTKHRLRRNRLVYVRRSGLRKFAVEAQIEFVVRAVAERHRLNFTVFGDRPSPPLSTAAELFNDAVAVVGPHGAGLSNVVFCEPGTAVIEGVCNEPHVNMCYQMTAHMLGLRYHAVPSRGGCERVVDVTPSEVENAVEAYVDMVLADMRRKPQQ